ncbi:MAG: DUF6788 family protein [Nocardioidaceae bacterium]
MPRRPSKQAPRLLRGTLFVLRRKCGKANCRCATGEAHETPALAYPVGGRTKTMTLARADLEQVRAALASYQAARAELDAQADAGIAELREQLQRRRS